ncbi:hypothetical protein WISP_23674 [Willisornis vidua]|uniref:Uncharacterized protein n=1 Tax=Willisornis vidua TaxID=1566151 RepID=A0ABQ9DTL6_9PASS|nr:hypothetical protein WISP_23674 [Willisornis vidua]
MGPGTRQSSLDTSVVVSLVSEELEGLAPVTGAVGMLKQSKVTMCNNMNQLVLKGTTNGTSIYESIDVGENKMLTTYHFRLDATVNSLECEIQRPHRLKGILSEFADNTKLGGAVPSLEGREALQRDFDKLQDWAITNHMNFNKGKCWFLYLGWGDPGYAHRLGNEGMKSSAIVRDLGVLVNGKLTMSQQCPGSQEGQPCPGGHQAQHHQPVKGGDCPALLSTGTASPGILCAGLGTTI